MKSQSFLNLNPNDHDKVIMKMILDEIESSRYLIVARFGVIAVASLLVIVGFAFVFNFKVLVLCIVFAAICCLFKGIWEDYFLKIWQKRVLALNIKYSRGEESFSGFRFDIKCNSGERDLVITLYQLSKREIELSKKNIANEMNLNSSAHLSSLPSEANRIKNDGPLSPRSQHIESLKRTLDAQGLELAYTKTKKELREIQLEELRTGITTPSSLATEIGPRLKITNLSHS